jgi:alkanesulfonate monooxygenase SsuD/methylene tetrahydromethanopterin reductase-like flavin-dependent oxidoreductase (luciferase family)
VTVGFGVNLRFRSRAGTQVSWPALYRQHLRMARFAEDLSFDGVVVPEHHSVDDGYNPAPLVVLGALAAATRRIRLGTQVFLLPLHNPVLAAEEFAGVDVLSGGRAEISLGLGYRAGDFAALGVDFERRGALIEEGLTLFLRALSDPGPFDFEGEHYHGAGIALTPGPVQKPRPPVALSVRSGVAARRAGRHGLSANIITRGVDATGLAALYADELAAAGHDPATCTITTVQDGVLAADRGRALAVAGELLLADRQAHRRLLGREGPERDGGLLDAIARDEFTPLVAGDWVRLIERALTAFEKCRVPLTRFNVSVWPPGMDFDEGRRALELFATAVLPRFQ